MRLVIKASGTSSVFLEVEGCAHDTMLQMLSPGEVAWQNLRTVKHGCEVTLPVRGVQYVFRLADETGRTPFSTTSLKVLTPPPTPAALGMGRNVCIFWNFEKPGGMSPEVAASVIEQSNIRYIVNWQRECGMVPSSSLKGETELEQREIVSGNRSRFLAAFPCLQANTGYRITLQTVSAGNSKEPFKSVESSPLYWSTGLDPPLPLVRITTSNEVTLRLPTEIDADSMLAMLKLKSRHVFEGQRDGARAFRRLQGRPGCTSLPSGDSIGLLRISADLRCSIRIRCAIDLRPLGAQTFFWDVTKTLELETLPNPPSFTGSAAQALLQGSSLVTSWLLQPVNSRATCVHSAYQVQIYSYTVYHGTTSTGVLWRSAHPSA